MSAYKNIPMTPELRRKLFSVKSTRYRTIYDYAAALIQLVHYVDGDGREIGFDYGYIHAAILRKFPTVKFGGPHKGHPTKMPYKELQEIACDLNRKGIRLPFRPRRKAKKNKEHQA